MSDDVNFCRWSPSLGALEDTAEKIWGTPEYEYDLNEATVFFGLYGFPDFYALWRHRGKKWILWAGSDIKHFLEGYHLEDGGAIKLDPAALARWINKHCESWVENQVEYKALAEIGIRSQICPSFLGRIEDYPISYKPSDRPKVYTSVSGDELKLYGWEKIAPLAEQHPNIEFHLYGNTEPFPTPFVNMIDHGRVPKERMNAETKEMQGALRLTEFDGFSEILAKSILWGQWPISLIPYEHILPVNEIGLLKELTGPNIGGREYYRKILNKFPWSTKS